MTTPPFDPGRLTLDDLAHVLRIQTAVTDVLAEMQPATVIRLGLLPLAELLGVTDRWTTR